MLSFKNGVSLVQNLSELPNFKGAKVLYGDIETTSGDPKKRSVSPWRDCDVAGLCVTVDDCPNAFYVPVGHNRGGNLPREAVIDWWCDIVDNCEEWVNQNIKYDAHVSTNWLGVMPECKMTCLLNGAKIINSDRRNYVIENLAADWLKTDIVQYKRALEPYLGQSKDFGDIPVDIIAPYGGEDVLTGRRLHQYELQRLHPDCQGVWDTEQALTSILFDMERNGLKVNPPMLQFKEYQITNRLLEIDSELADIVGRNFRPHVNEDCYDVFCNQYGLPIMKYTTDDYGEPTNNPSFDKEALADYLAHPQSPLDVVNRVIEYRKLNTINNFFVRPYQALVDIDSRLHPTYNQTVRTGRMSCREPNSQQLSTAAKELVIADEGKVIVSIDYSQIEFRLIAHYINDPDCIEAYNENPETDFHTWVAELCGIPRKPAKNVNFCMGYGGGKEKLITMLSSNVDLIGDLRDKVTALLEDGRISQEQVVPTFEMLCRRRATDVYNSYHEALPNLKRTSRKCAQVCESRGYVRTLYGRHRHLPTSHSHKAFNSICQGSAADLMKERTVAVHKQLPSHVKMLAQVHDALVFECPEESMKDEELWREITDTMCSPTASLRLPVTVSIGYGKNWAAAGKMEMPLSQFFGGRHG